MNQEQQAAFAAALEATKPDAIGTILDYLFLAGWTAGQAAQRAEMKKLRGDSDAREKEL